MADYLRFQLPGERIDFAFSSFPSNNSHDLILAAHAGGVDKTFGTMSQSLLLFLILSRVEKLLQPRFQSKRQQKLGL